MNEEVTVTEHWMKPENNRNNNKIENFLLRRDVDKKKKQVLKTNV